AVSMVDAVLAAHPDDVRLVYKFVVLSMHVRADPAARAAWAAGQQGKFWEMEHLLFERQDHLEQADLERYARDLKLKGTPTLYVNGREVDLEGDEILEDRVAAELGVASAGSASASASASAAPAPSAAPSSAR